MSAARDLPVPAQPDAAVEPLWQAVAELPAIWRLAFVPTLLWLTLIPLAAAFSAPAEGAETRFLGLLASGVVACIAALAPRLRLAEMAALLSMAVLWCVHEGAGRGSLVVLTLMTGLALAAHHGWRRLATRPAGNLADSAAFFIPVAVGWQLLVRPDLLLPPLLDARTLISLTVIPGAAGLALAVLARAHGAEAARLAGLVAAVLAPGFNVTITAGLVALAAGSCIARQELILRAGSGLSLLLATLVSWPSSVAVMAAGGLAPAEQNTRRCAVFGAAVIAFSVAVAQFLPAAPAIGSSIFIVLLALCLTPAAWLAPAPRIILGLALVIAGSLVQADPEAMVVGLAFLALSVPESSRPFQLHWSLMVLGLVGLSSGYPWLRPDPILLAQPATLALWPLAPVALALAAWSVQLLSRRWHLAPGKLLWLTVFALLLAVAPPAPIAVFDQPRILVHGSQPLAFQLEPPPTSLSSVVIDSSLVHGVEVPSGTAVAQVVWLDGDGHVVARIPLLAGEHTADWAAGRADVAARPNFRSPQPWARSLAPDGNFFAQRFRAHLRAESVVTAEVQIVRSDALPEATQIHLHRLEIRP